MKTLCAAVESAARQGDLHSTLERNNAFQFTVYQAAQSPVLLRLIEVLRMQSVPHCTAAVRAMLEERPGYYSQSWSNHAALVAAIAARDADQARRIKRHDLEQFRAFVESVRSRQP